MTNGKSNSGRRHFLQHLSTLKCQPDPGLLASTPSVLSAQTPHVFPYLPLMTHQGFPNLRLLATRGGLLFTRLSNGWIIAATPAQLGHSVGAGFSDAPLSALSTFHTNCSRGWPPTMENGPPGDDVGRPHQLLHLQPHGLPSVSPPTFLSCFVSLNPGRTSVKACWAHNEHSSPLQDAQTAHSSPSAGQPLTPWLTVWGQGWPVSPQGRWLTPLWEGSQNKQLIPAIPGLKKKTPNQISHHIPP